MRWLLLEPLPGCKVRIEFTEIVGMTPTCRYTNTCRCVLVPISVLPNKGRACESIMIQIAKLIGRLSSTGILCTVFEMYMRDVQSIRVILTRMFKLNVQTFEIFLAKKNKRFYLKNNICFVFNNDAILNYRWNKCKLLRINYHERKREVQCPVIECNCRFRDYCCHWRSDYGCVSALGTRTKFHEKECDINTVKESKRGFRFCEKKAFTVGRNEKFISTPRKLAKTRAQPFSRARWMPR